MDGTSFNKLGDEVARNTPGPNSYNYLHKTPGAGMNYYRLQIVSLSGKKYSQIVSVANNSNGKTGVTVFPNPVARGYLGIQFNNMRAGSFSVIIFSMAGQTVMEKNVTHAGGNSAILDNMNELTKTGLNGVALISAIMKSDDPQTATKAFKDKLSSISK